VLDEAERDLGARERDPTQELSDGGRLARRRAQELPPRRRIEEELADLDAGAGRRARRLEGQVLAAAHAEPGAGVDAVEPGPDLALGRGGDGRQRLAAEAERRDGEEILFAADLARRVRAERDRQVLGRHAVAVVGDGDALDAPAVDLDHDRARARVE